MSLADEAKSGPPQADKHPNALVKWLGKLPDAEHTAALNMLTNPDWKNRELWESFTRHGLAISHSHFVRLRADQAWK